MVKKISVRVPTYLKKFIENGGDYVVIDGVVHVDKSSLLGQLIHFGSWDIPYTVKYDKPVNTDKSLTIKYYCRDKVYDLHPKKIEMLPEVLDKIFRSTLITYVRNGHYLCGGDYGPFVTQFLAHYEIIADVDLSWETARKIYRDYLEKTSKKNKKIFA